MSSYIDACQRISPSLSHIEGNYLSSDHISYLHQIVSISHFFPYGVTRLVRLVTCKEQESLVMWGALVFLHPTLAPGLLLAEGLSAASPRCDAAMGRERWWCRGEGATMLPWASSGLAAEGQWMCPCRCRGLFGSVSHLAGGVGGAAISTEQLSVPSWKQIHIGGIVWAFSFSFFRHELEETVCLFSYRARLRLHLCYCDTNAPLETIRNPREVCFCAKIIRKKIITENSC